MLYQVVIWSVNQCGAKCGSDCGCSAKNAKKNKNVKNRNPMNVLVIYLDRTKINKNGQNHTKTGKIIQCYITGLIDLVWGKPQKWEKFNLKTNQKRGKIEKTKVEARCVCEELGRFIFRQQLAVVGLTLGVSHSCFIAWFVPSTLWCDTSKGESFFRSPLWEWLSVDGQVIWISGLEMCELVRV